MREEGSIWKATAAVDPVLIGRIGMRLMAMKLHGDETPDTYQLEPKLIVSDMLKAGHQHGYSGSGDRRLACFR